MVCARCVRQWIIRVTLEAAVRRVHLRAIAEAAAGRVAELQQERAAKRQLLRAQLSAVLETKVAEVERRRREELAAIEERRKKIEEEESLRRIAALKEAFRLDQLKKKEEDDKLRRQAEAEAGVEEEERQRAFRAQQLRQQQEEQRKSKRPLSSSPRGLVAQSDPKCNYIGTGEKKSGTPVGIDSDEEYMDWSGEHRKKQRDLLDRQESVRYRRKEVEGKILTLSNTMMQGAFRGMDPSRLKKQQRLLTALQVTKEELESEHKRISSELKELNQFAARLRNQPKSPPHPRNSPSQPSFPQASSPPSTNDVHAEPLQFPLCELRDGDYRSSEYEDLGPDCDDHEAAVRAISNIEQRVHSTVDAKSVLQKDALGGGQGPNGVNSCVARVQRRIYSDKAEVKATKALDEASAADGFVLDGSATPQAGRGSRTELRGVYGLTTRVEHGVGLSRNGSSKGSLPAVVVAPNGCMHTPANEPAHQPQALAATPSADPFNEIKSLWDGDLFEECVNDLISMSHTGGNPNRDELNWWAVEELAKARMMATGRENDSEGVETSSAASPPRQTAPLRLRPRSASYFHPAAKQQQSTTRGPSALALHPSGPGSQQSKVGRAAVENTSLSGLVHGDEQQPIAGTAWSNDGAMASTHKISSDLHLMQQASTGYFQPRARDKSINCDIISSR